MTIFIITVIIIIIKIRYSRPVHTRLIQINSSHYLDIQSAYWIEEKKFKKKTENNDKSKFDSIKIDFMQSQSD